MVFIISIFFYCTGKNKNHEKESYDKANHLKFEEDKRIRNAKSNSPLILPDSTTKLANQDVVKSNLASELSSIPFDGLLDNAQEVTINTDEIEQRKLNFLRKIGEREIPGQNEPILWRPTSIARYKDKIAICDSKLNQAYILSCDGELLTTIGSKGRGPGEFISPIEIITWNDHLFIIDGSLGLHEFTNKFEFKTRYSLENELPHYSGMGIIDDILFLPASLLPTPRTKLIQVYEMKKYKLRLINSFYDYYKPQKNYSSQMGALLTFNRMRLATNGQRFVAFGRTRENIIFLLDLYNNENKKIIIKNAKLLSFLKDKINDNAPDFASKELFKEIVFDEKENLYILIPNGILKINNVTSNFQGSVIYSFESLEYDNKTNFPFGGYDNFTVNNERIFLLSSFIAILTIFEM